MKTNNENYYVVRTDRAGVFFGQIKSKEDNSITMTNVRKIFYWEGAAAVEQIALDGLDKNKSKLTVTIDVMEIFAPIQIIPCSEKSTKILKNCKEWKM